MEKNNILKIQLKLEDNLKFKKIADTTFNIKLGDEIFKAKKPIGFAQMNDKEQEEHLKKINIEAKEKQSAVFYERIAELEAYADEVNKIGVLKKDEQKNNCAWNAIPTTSDVEGDIRKALKLLKRCGFIKSVSVDHETGELQIEFEDNPENIVEGVICGDIFEGDDRGHYNYALFKILYKIKHTVGVGEKLHLIKGNHDLYTGAGKYMAETGSEVDYYKKMIYPYLENRWIKEIEETNPNNPSEKKKVFFVFQHAFFTDGNGELKKKLGEDYDDYKTLGNDNNKKIKWREENCCNPNITNSFQRMEASKRKGYYNQGEDDYLAFGYFPALTSNEARAKERFQQNDIEQRLVKLVNNLKSEDPGKFEDLNTDNIRLVFGHEHSSSVYYPGCKCDDKSKNIFMVDTDAYNEGDVYEIPANAFKQHGENHYYGAMKTIEGGDPARSLERVDAYNKLIAEKEKPWPFIAQEREKRRIEREKRSIELMNSYLNTFGITIEQTNDDNKNKQSEQRIGGQSQQISSVKNKQQVSNNKKEDKDKNTDNETGKKIQEDVGIWNNKSGEVKKKQEEDDENEVLLESLPPITIKNLNPPQNSNYTAQNIGTRNANDNETNDKKSNTTPNTLSSENKKRRTMLSSNTINDKKKTQETLLKTNNLTNTKIGTLTSLSSIMPKNNILFNQSSDGVDIFTNYSNNSGAKNNVLNNNIRQPETTNSNNVNSNNQNDTSVQNISNKQQQETSFTIPAVAGFVAMAGGLTSVLSFADVIKFIPPTGKIILSIASGLLGCFAVAYGYNISQENKKINNQNASTNTGSLNELRTISNHK